MSAEAVERLTQLYVAAGQSNRHLINTELVQQQNELAAFLQQSFAANATVKMKLQKKLQKMQDDYNAILQTLQTIRGIKNSLPPGHTKELLWCHAIEANLQTLIAKNGLVMQKQLEIKIQALEVV